jgi:hypothetical protein
MTEMQTETLVDLLVKDAKAVRPLAPPGQRVMIWLLPTLVYIAAITVIMGPRPDLLQQLSQPRFAVELGATLITGVLAAMAAFCSECPGRPQWERLVPLPAFAIWLAALGEGCWQSWLRFGIEGLRVEPDFACIPAVIGLSLLPAILLFWMIRKGAPIAPAVTAGLATLAASAIGAFTLRIVHYQDASVMVLLWQFGSVAALTALGAASGRRFLRWPDRVQSRSLT